MEHIRVVEGLHSTGAIDARRDLRDHKLTRLGQAVTPFDWVKGFDVESKIPPLPTEDQNGSSSCGGQAARYLMEALKQLKTGTFTHLSAKDPYSLIFYPQGGTDIRSLAKILVQRGVAQETVVPSYDNGQPPTEPFMEDSSVSKTLNYNSGLYKEFAFGFPNLDIESIAQAIRDNNGCILQVNGQNNGTWLSPYPQPPMQAQWSHFLWACGAQMINGVKYIKVLNSWGTSVGDNGVQWLSEGFFNGAVTNAVVFYDTTLYQYKPTGLQTVVNWLVKFMQWAGLYSH